MSSVSPFQRSKRLAAIEISEIVQISEQAAQLRKKGHDIVSLGTGEPDFDTPDHIKQAAADAMWSGMTKYAPTRGTPELLQAIADKFKRENDVDLQPSEVIVSTGAKQVLFNAFMATLEAGDEVIIPAPYWTSYVDIVAMCGGSVHSIPCGAQQSFKMTPAQLEAAIGPRTRWLLLNSPSNPTGALYSEAELRGLGEVLQRHPHVWLMTDEIYEHIVYSDAGFISARKALPELAQRTLIVNGVSKAYAMTGWRIGYGAGPAELIAAMAASQGQATSGACSISQAAALQALTGNQEHIPVRRDAFRARRDSIVNAINSIDGLACEVPDGAFYVYPSCAGVIGKRTPQGEELTSDADFCRYLLEAHQLAVVPGRAFAVPGYFRISYAYSQDALQEAMRRIKVACSELK